MGSNGGATHERRCTARGAGRCTAAAAAAAARGSLLKYCTACMPPMMDILSELTCDICEKPQPSAARGGQGASGGGRLKRRAGRAVRRLDWWPLQHGVPALSASARELRQNRAGQRPLTLLQEALVVEHGHAVEDHQHGLRQQQRIRLGSDELARHPAATNWCGMPCGAAGPARRGAQADLDQRPERHVGCRAQGRWKLETDSRPRLGTRAELPPWHHQRAIASEWPAEASGARSQASCAFLVSTTTRAGARAAGTVN